MKIKEMKNKIEAINRDLSKVHKNFKKKYKIVLNLKYKNVADKHQSMQLLNPEHEKNTLLEECSAEIFNFRKIFKELNDEFGDNCKQASLKLKGLHTLIKTIEDSERTKLQNGIEPLTELQIRKINNAIQNQDLDKNSELEINLIIQTLGECIKKIKQLIKIIQQEEGKDFIPSTFPTHSLPEANTQAICPSSPINAPRVAEKLSGTPDSFGYKKVPFNFAHFFYNPENIFKEDEEISKESTYMP